jgi:hypothetical protein
MSIDNILDLTDRDALVWFFKRHYVYDKDWHWAILLDALFDQQLGGDNYVSFAGQMALKDGYDGIAFFSVRSLGSAWPEPGNLDYRRDFDLISYNHEELRSDQNCVNLVIYFGHNVVRATKNIFTTTSIIDNGNKIIKNFSIDNQFFGASYSEIDKLFQADPDRPPEEDLTYEALRDRVERTVWRGKPGIYYEPYKPKEEQ